MNLHRVIELDNFCVLLCFRNILFVNLKKKADKDKKKYEYIHFKNETQFEIQKFIALTKWTVILTKMNLFYILFLFIYLRMSKN